MFTGPLFMSCAATQFDGSFASGRPPAIVLGGGANALSVARRLGRRGIAVHAINDRTSYVRHSRYCRWVPLPDEGPRDAVWSEFLLGPASDRLRGAVLLACSDEGIQFIAGHRQQLLEKYRLDESDPTAQQAMLNKRSTYQHAVAAGVPTPRFWLVRSAMEVAGLKDSLVYPLLVKPLYSHVFEQRFGQKFVIARRYDDLVAAFDEVSGAGIEAMLVEMVPGPDDRLCSYYTYLDESGQPLFDFTKRVIRRYPANMGAACYHVTDDVPEVKELALKLFRQVGLRGLANVEFKRDHRDGQLKLIECNARFTAANCQVARAGYDLAWFVYSRLTGLPQEPFGNLRSGVRLWYPIEDFKAFRELHARGELTWAGWLKSLLHRQSFPFFSWSDPLPTLAAECRRFARRLRRRQR